MNKYEYALQHNKASHTEAELLALEYSITNGKLPSEILIELMGEALQSAGCKRETKAYLAVFGEPSSSLSEEVDRVFDFYKERIKDAFSDELGSGE